MFRRFEHILKPAKYCSCKEQVGFASLDLVSVDTHHVQQFSTSFNKFQEIKDWPKVFTSVQTSAFRIWRLYYRLLNSSELTHSYLERYVLRFLERQIITYFVEIRFFYSLISIFDFLMHFIQLVIFVSLILSEFTE